MSKTPTIEIDMDKNCVKCGKPGAAKNGWCLGCVAKNIHLFVKKKTR